MCTLSWIRGADGYSVFFNRDEQRSRAPGTPPMLHARHPVPFMAPGDPDGGGTWIASNAYGVTVLVLNRYDVDARLPANPVSRGTLVMSLAVLSTGEAAGAQLARSDLSRFRPFTLAVFEAGQPATLLGWDGTVLSETRVADAGLVATSSSYHQGRADVVRRTLFQRALAAAPLDDDLLNHLHANHADGQRALSPCMHRDDACTVSLTRVGVGPDRVEMHYQAGAPCEGSPVQRLDLVRRRVTTSGLHGSSGQPQS
jgi:hypothetical protein